VIKIIFENPYFKIWYNKINIMTKEIILISSLSVISTLFGIGIAYLIVNYVKNPSIKKPLEATAIGYSAGIMVVLSLVELLWHPMQIANKFNVITWFIFGIIIIWLLDLILPHIHHFHEKAGERKYLLKLGLLIAVGFILHDFPEGMSIAGTYSISKEWGLLVGLSVALHNIPEEFAMSLPIIMLNNVKLLIIIGILSALAEPMGALIGIAVTSQYGVIIPYFTAFAGGAMIYIAVSELAPFGLKIKPEKYFAIGSIVGIISYFLLSYLL